MGLVDPVGPLLGLLTGCWNVSDSYQGCLPGPALLTTLYSQSGKAAPLPCFLPSLLASPNHRLVGLITPYMRNW